METFIAVDIGASSGRLIKSQLVDGQIEMEEIHRFKNGFQLKNEFERWNIDSLANEILIGLEKLKKQGILECFIGIDTWGVDYCLVDINHELVDQPIAYRDERTSQAVNDFSKKMPLDVLYKKTGIQIQPFNTIFQLFVESEDRLASAEKLLLIPDYLGYFFTGKLAMEKTNASTTQLLNVETKDWDTEILNLLGISAELFPPLVNPGEILGDLLQEKFPTFDLPKATFINIASHDTASAVLGTPGEGNDWAYISSGTWSLLGVEVQQANVENEAYLSNYTNEWGANETIRFLKNIMGMWVIQEVARMQNYEYTYAELAQLATTVPAFQQFVAINDERFLNPKNMIDELKAYCRETQQTIPETAAEIARCVYDNLALCYAVELQKLQNLKLDHTKINKLHIVGGGANNQLLNQLTANVTKITVEAGPSEATAIGNLVLQMICAGKFSSVEEARACIRRSFDSISYQPQAFDPNILQKYQRTIIK